MKIGPHFFEEHALTDGSKVTLRTIRPDDGPAIVALFEALSVESRYHRFFGVVGGLSSEMIRYLTSIDGVDHVAIVATSSDDPKIPERVVAVGRFIRRAEARDTAEVALTVVDAFQRKRLGTLLLETITVAARERGIRAFHLEVKRSNAAMRGLLEEQGSVLRRDAGGELIYEVVLPVPRPQRLVKAFGAQLAQLFARLVGHRRLSARDAHDREQRP